MPAAKYSAIYQSLREKIESQEYEGQTMLPSEHQLIVQYDCSRNTVRRAIRQLADEGYVQSVHGKGVQIIYQPREQREDDDFREWTEGGIGGASIAEMLENQNKNND